MIEYSCKKPQELVCIRSNPEKLPILDDIGNKPVYHKKFILERKNIMKKRFAIKGFSFVLVLAMLIVGMVVVPASAEAAPKYEPDTTWGADEDGVYRIYDAPDFLQFLTSVYRAFEKTPGNWVMEGDTYVGKTVMLMADIDLNPGWDASSKTEPANKWISLSIFNGSFAGNGHTLRGIYYHSSSDFRCALFGEYKTDVNETRPAVINNLVVENSYIKAENGESTSYYGTGLFYHTLNSKKSTVSFENVYVAEDVYMDTTFGQIGGYVGRTWAWDNPNPVNFTDCVFAGTINSTGMYGSDFIESTSVGGFLGCDRIQQNFTANYTRCTFSGTINAKGAAGGFTGKVGSLNHTMTECVSAGTVNSETQGSAGAFAVLDYRIYTGDKDPKSTASWSTGENKHVNLINCYQIGSIDSIGYGMKDGQVVDVVINNKVNELEQRYSVTVQYGAEEAKTYQPVTSAENVTAIRSAVKKVESKKALLDMEQFAKWAISTDGKTLIPAGLARSMFAIRIAGFQTSTPENDAFSIRYVAVLDNLESYSKAGYEVEVTREADGKKAAETLETSTVYTGINTPNGVVTAEDLNGSYICGLSVKNIPTTGTYTLKIRAYLIGIDGETIYYSTSVNVRVVNGVASYI